MVYCGPISKGCERCRRRKIKCGQERPGCAQCAKAKTPCAGYRNPVDLVFRDETARLAGKAQAQVQKRANSKKLPIVDQAAREVTKSSPDSLTSASTRSTNSGPSTNSSSPLEPSLVEFILDKEIAGALQTLNSPHSEFGTLNYALTPSISDRAASFFFGNFTVSDAPGATGFNAFLEKRYHGDCPDAALPVAMEALGMAGIANMFNAPEILVKAERRYGQALALTNKCLSDSVQALSDNVLAAIWFLGIFESMVSSTFTQYRSWHAHIQGASTLIKLRGEQQFKSDLGRILFFKFRGQLISACLQRNIPIPQSVQKWVLTVTDDGVVDRPRHFGPDVMAFVPAQSSVKLCNLRSAIERGEMTDPREIITAALEITRDLREMMNQDYADWAPQSVVVPEPSEHAYKGKYEIHQSHLKAQSWNHLRVLLVLTYEAIVQQCRVLQDRKGEDGIKLEEVVLLNGSIATIRQLAEQICSCVPYVLGKMPPRLEPVMERQSQVADGLSIIWGLFVVADSALLDSDMREWARGRLQYINRVTGVRQAGLMAAALEKGPNIDLPDMLEAQKDIAEQKTADFFAAVAVEDVENSFRNKLASIPLARAMRNPTHTSRYG